jgi:hypothetical protein
MKKIIFILIVFLLSIILYSCNTCHNPQYEAIPTELLSYVGMFQPGNWWTYKNLRGTKSDSIYVTDYNDSKTGSKWNKDECGYTEVRTFNIHHNYLFPYGNSAAASIQCANSTGQGTNGSCFTFECYNSIHETYCGNTNSFSPDSLYNKFTIDSTSYNNVMILFNCVSGCTKVIIQKNLGIVIYTTPMDTFKLIKYNI